MAGTVDQVDREIEALLVTADVPVPLAEIEEAYGITVTTQALQRIGAFWSDRAWTLRREEGGILLRPSPDVVEFLEEGVGRGPQRLGRASLSTLAVIALHQPVTVADIERIRGVKISRALLDSLVSSELVRVATRRTDSGRAAIYTTTDLFLEAYGLGALTDLPTPAEVGDLV